jgi:hypothetical protein
MDETPDCEAVRPLLEELATGAVTGHDRAFALMHVAHCDRCRRELTELTRVADDLLLLAPRREPPAGFDAAVARRLATLTDRSSRWVSWRRWAPAGRGAVARTSGLGALSERGASRRTRPALRLAAAAIMLLIAAAAGAGITYWQGAADRRLAAQVGTAASLFPRAVPITGPSNAVVGHVFLYNGSPSWATVELTSAPESGDYAMTVVATDGQRYPEGVCTVTGQRGISSYPLPVPLGQIAAIDLTRPGIALTGHP